MKKYLVELIDKSKRRSDKRRLVSDIISASSPREAAKIANSRYPSADYFETRKISEFVNFEIKKNKLRKVS